MEVNDALLDKLANLARLDIEPAERENLKQDLQRMISFVEKLQELNMGGTDPQLHMTDAADVLREIARSMPDVLRRRLGDRNRL